MRGGEEQVWRALLQGARDGEEGCLRKILERHEAAARSVISINPKYRRILSQDDVMQVTFLEACTVLAAFDGAETEFERLFKRIAQNNLRDAIRAIEADRRPSLDDQLGADDLLALTRSGTTPSRRMSRGEEAELLNRTIDLLPADYRRVLRERFFERLAVRDVAERMGRSVGAVHLLQHRAIERLRSLLIESGAFSWDLRKDSSEDSPESE